MGAPRDERRGRLRRVEGSSGWWVNDKMMMMMMRFYLGRSFPGACTQASSVELAPGDQELDLTVAPGDLIGRLEGGKEQFAACDWLAG